MTTEDRAGMVAHDPELAAFLRSEHPLVGANIYSMECACGQQEGRDYYAHLASVVAARVEEARAEDRATIARVEALAADNGAWKGEKHVRITRRAPRLGADVTESYVKVSDLRAALASPDTTGECANYRPPLTCLTAPSSVTGRCDHCTRQAGTTGEASS